MVGCSGLLVNVEVVLVLSNQCCVRPSHAITFRTPFTQLLTRFGFYVQH